MSERHGTGKHRTCETQTAHERHTRGSPRWLAAAQCIFAVVVAVAVAAALRGVVAGAETPSASKPISDIVMMWGFIAAALSTGIGALGAAYAVSHVGSAALGAMGERPEVAGRALIFVGLAEGIAIYGLIISIMILARLG